MWIQSSPTHIFSCDASRVESITVRPIMHSDSFGLFFKGREEIILEGGDLDQTRELLALVGSALAEGRHFLDLSERLK
jgi:hypothetical protein